MAEDRVRFGIIGCANIARKLARAITLAPNSTLYAIGSRSINKANQFVSTNGLSPTIKVYGSYDEVLDDPLVDVVYLPLPTSLHLHWAVLVANKKKHLLIEKPTALDVDDLDKILQACASNGVQFMDGSMWLHHPRTHKMKEMLFDSGNLGQLDYVSLLTTIYSSSTFTASTQILTEDIRVKPDLDALGALGDLGWYCVGIILWAKNYQLPTSVTALTDTVTKNAAGVILSCTASIEYNQPERTIATMHCSFFSHGSMDLLLSGTKGSLRLKDYILPFQEDSASFDYTLGAKFVDMHIGWNVKPDRVVVASELPQEALMIQELARLVEGIKKFGHRPEDKWPDISRKTQLVLDAVKKSVDIGCKIVNL
ncbi:hypothetical protein ACFE04_009040 [Oxalis oulophora]